MVTDSREPETARRRPVRSFVRREGRLTEGQQRALDTLMPRFGIDADGAVIDLPAAFGRDAPTVLDIGFGDGAALAAMASTHPERNYLGIEVHRPGVGRLLRQLDTERIDNVRVICADATEVLRHGIADGSLAGIQVFFPDPWPKKRHHKRRMIQPAWLDLVLPKLAPGAFLHLATDWEDYARQMLEVVSDCQGLENTAGPGRFSDHRGDRPETKFERRGINKGHGVWDLILLRR
ncbi:MAG: tRNA (guanosine(46)-N7)-methyltransferase TrmB [Ectothiorhodospiraceae bacterium]